MRHIQDVQSGDLKDSSHRGKRSRTPPQVLGPYFPVALTPVAGGDLTTGGRAQGEIIEIRGRVFNRDGDPVAGAKLTIWQANHQGRYRHANDTNPVALDPNFVGFAEIVSGHDGTYRLKTVKPGTYHAASGQLRPPHIHFEIHGRYERLITQMYFPDEPLNESDRPLMSTNAPDILVASRDPGDPHSFTFDIVLERG
jgi:protocatechuate 3,4-dioxygenase beta subunit